MKPNRHRASIAATALAGTMLLLSGVALAGTTRVTKGSLPSRTVADLNVLASRESAVVAQLRAFRHLAKSAPLAPWEARLKEAEAAQAAAEAAFATSLSQQVAPPKPARTSATHVVGSGHASGDYAIAQASGTANEPAKIELSLAATPSQSATVSWDLICDESGGGVGSKTGQSTLSLPTVDVLALPAPSTSCIVSASAQISSSGTVTVSIESVS